MTRLHQYIRDTSRAQAERINIDATLKACLPDRVSAYLFEDGLVRNRPFDLTPLQMLIDRNVDDLVAYVEGAFRQGWPEADADVTRPEALRDHVRGMVRGLEEVLARLGRRLRWALEQIKRLSAVCAVQGDLDPEDEALFRRCDAVVKRLKGTARRGRREAEGYDDVNTFGVLAAEGFLPGYGLEVGSVLGTAGHSATAITTSILTARRRRGVLRRGDRAYRYRMRYRRSSLRRNQQKERTQSTKRNDGCVTCSSRPDSKRGFEGNKSDSTARSGRPRRTSSTALRTTARTKACASISTG